MHFLEVADNKRVALAEIERIAARRFTGPL
jgi:hypothetical protein